MDETPFFTVLSTVDSTNNYAMAAITDGLAKHGMAWFAKAQTAGKGQRGKAWAGQKGKNIAMSLVLEPQKLWGNTGKMHNQFYLSAAVALSCLQFLNRFANGEIKIKWPNDLYWQNRKAAGILIENKLQGNAWKWAVVGIGININQTDFDAGLQHAVSLTQITGKIFDAVELAEQLHGLLIKNLSTPINFDDLMQQYNQHLYKKNETVTLRCNGIKFETLIKEVSSTGRLITVDAIEREFDFGEVEWVM